MSGGSEAFEPRGSGGTGPADAGVQAHPIRISAEDLRRLAAAKTALGRPSLAIRLASMVGVRIDALLRRVPGGAHDKITELAEAALRKCLDVALKTLPANTAKPHALARTSTRDDVDADTGMNAHAHDTMRANTRGTSVARRAFGRLGERMVEGARSQSRNLHKLAVIGTGAAGGAFGMVALPAELPVTTTLMFRSICAIAQAHGEPLDDPEVQMQCLLVLALGGPASDDDEAQWGYFMVRGALAQTISRASSELAAKGLGAQSSSVVLQLIRQIASRLSVQISEQVAAKSVPALGAVLGAAINAAFIDHFQKIAEAHFTVRALERRYGAAVLRQQWDTLPD